MRVNNEIASMTDIQNPLLRNQSPYIPLVQSPVKRNPFTSPETRNYRFQREWRHIQDTPLLSTAENNNGELLPYNLNFADNCNETNLAPSPTTAKFIHSVMNSDDSDTSSEDEDSSLCFSDSSRLLDVSSLDDSSSSSGEDVNTDTEMSDNDIDYMPENLDLDDDEEEVVDFGNNNIEEEVDEDHFEHDALVDARYEDHSIDTSWMSYSSEESQKLSIGGDVIKRRGTSPRNGVVMPDVLPIEEPLNDGVEMDLPVRKRDLKLDAAHRVSRECCIVEITTQPDIQVDIRLNPASNSPFAGAYVKHGNTYPRDSSKNYNFYFKAKDVAPTRMRNSLGSIQDTSTAPPCFALGEGIRLNNFTIVNSFKALNLTELFETTDVVQQKSSSTRDKMKLDQLTLEIPKEKDSPSRQLETLEYNPPSDNFQFQEDDEEATKRCRNQCSLHEMKRCAVAGSERKTKNNVLNNYPRPVLSTDEPDIVSQRVCRRTTNNWDHEHFQQVTKGSNSPATKESISTGQGDSKVSSPELFEVYTNETAMTNSWTSVARGTGRESEWIKMRRNDREEIRKKLAMDSDNEDYISEKPITYHSSSISSDVGLKRGGSLQICFMNEAAKDSDGSDEHPSPEQCPEPLPVPPARVMKKNQLFPPSLSKNTLSSKLQNNNNVSSQVEVVKRQRPTFFFNRPHSWHAAKVDAKREIEEDIVTRHRRLQSEAREALAQAKAMARMQMEIERQKKKKSPIAEIVGITFPDGRNFLSRPALMDMNVAQLQVIVNDLHSQIETLNEDLVKFLLTRDDLHMEQDSMLVDIEDFTRYLGLKGNTSMTHLPDVKLASNLTDNIFNKKLLKQEPVCRPQSMHLKSKPVL